MAGIKNNAISLNLDGRVIQVKNPSRRNFDLNKALLDQDEFVKFVADPKGFASRYDLEIDSDVSQQLSARLMGVRSLDQLQVVVSRGTTVEATVWAVAVGAYSMASTKIAVAF